MFEKIIEISMLFDFYGQLLTAKQQQILRLYHEDDYSLSEIADELGISRQGVHDAVKKAEKALYEYEEKLGLVGKLLEAQERIDEIDIEIHGMMEESKDNKKIQEGLARIKTIMDGIPL